MKSEGSTVLELVTFRQFSFHPPSTSWPYWSTRRKCSISSRSAHPFLYTLFSSRLPMKTNNLLESSVRTRKLMRIWALDSLIFHLLILIVLILTLHISFFKSFFSNFFWFMVIFSLLLSRKHWIVRLKGDYLQ